MLSDSVHQAVMPRGYQPPKSVEEVLSRYSQGERFFQHTDLDDGASFQKADLSGSDFSNSWLSCADFRSANLRNVRFDDSNAKVTDFRDADLTGASFRGAGLCGASFAGAKLENVITVGATWYGCEVADNVVLAELPSK
jgi:uncharacterized protein YjbI with pentapeptide repeats